MIAKDAHFMNVIYIFKNVYVVLLDTMVQSGMKRIAFANTAYSFPGITDNDGKREGPAVRFARE